MQHQQALLAQLRVADRYHQVVLHLLEHLQPRLALVRRLELARVSATHVQDLHVLQLQRLELTVDHYVYQCVREQDLVEITQVTLQLIVERQVAQ